MTKESLKQEADALFASTAHNVLFANPRGEFFTSKNMALIGLKKDEEITEFNRPTETVKAPEKEYDFNAKDTIAKIKATASLEDLNAFEGDERKSVIAEYEKQHTKLVAEINVNVGSTEATPAGDGNADTDKKE